MWRKVIPALLVLALALACHWRVLYCDFLNYDDDVYVTENPHIQDGLNATSLAWAFSSTYESTWQPVTWLSYLTDVSLYGLDPVGFHATNLLLHLACVLFLFLGLRRLTDTTWPAFFVAAVFAVHPINVEAVAWVSERKGLLGGLFWALCLWTYAGYARSPNRSQFFLLCLWTALGMMSKPVLITLPFALLLLDLWPLGRLGVGGQGAETTWLVGRVWREKVPLLIICLGLGGLSLYAQKVGGAVADLNALPIGDRLGNALLAYVGYLEKAFWPTGLSVHYSYPRGGPGSAAMVGAALTLLAVSALAFLARRAAPYLLVGWLWFLGVLFPMIGLIQVGSHAAADRYAYVPFIGLFIMVVFGSAAAFEARGRPGRPIAFGLGALALGLLMTSAWSQIRVWKDSLSLFQRAVAVNPHSPRVHNNLGLALADRGRLDEAMSHYRTALKLRPADARAHTNLGLALMNRGDLEQALRHLEAAVRADPNYAVARNNLAIAYYRLGRYLDAQRELERGRRLGLRPHPGFVRALARALRRLPEDASPSGGGEPGAHQWRAGSIPDPNQRRN